MSQWTHVNGAIRFDGIRVLPGFNRHSIEKILGNTVNFSDPENAWDECNVPRGSEGSIQFFINENPHKESLSSFMVNIWGDLRDYDNIEKIQEWFEGVIAHKDVIIRSAILEIEVEFNQKFILIHRYDERQNHKIEKVACILK